MRHVSLIEGDGAGYDVASFELDGSDRFIEVKTSRGGPQTDFFLSANEVEFSRQHPKSYLPYRIYDFNAESAEGAYYVLRGSLGDELSLRLQAIQFVARLVYTG